MQLYIGGYAQGKLAYVQEKLKGQEVPVVNDLHLWVKQLLQEGKPAEEREYRERVGRLLIRLAEEAETVERIICGMGQKIK